MQPQDIAMVGGAVAPADVAGQQVTALGRFACQFAGLWAIVHVGRTQAALTSEREPALCTALQETRSRGCRALKLCFWRFAWWPSWLLAQRRPKKLCMWMSRSRPSRHIPANTSKTFGRALAAFWAVPALILSAGKKSAKNLASGAVLVALRRADVQGGDVFQDLTRRKLCVPSPFCLPSWLWLLLLLAPNPHLRPRQSSPSRPRPASTSDLTGRAFAPAPTQPSGWRAVAC
jgi:hypothetical protein